MTTFKLNDGTELKLLPFTLETAEEVLSIAAEVEGESETLAQVRGMTKMVAAAVARGNPSVTEEWLRKNVEMPQLRPLYDAVIAASGLQVRSADEGKAERP